MCQKKKKKKKKAGEVNARAIRETRRRIAFRYMDEGNNSRRRRLGWTDRGPRNRKD
jgi:hypothetical protein